MTSAAELASLRSQIKELDAEIIRLAAKRTNIAATIGRHKNNNDLPLKDYAVEQKVYDRNRIIGEAEGLDSTIVSELSRLLIRQSLLVQHEERSQNQLNRKSSNQKTISIIGANGGMGKWFCDYFASCGHIVNPLNIAPADQLSDSERRQLLSEALSTSEFVVISAPISASAALIAEIAAIGTEAIIFDIASVKGPFMPALIAAKTKLKIGSIHPMFGPNTRILIDRNIILCETEANAIDAAIADLFSHTSAKIKRIPLEKHDEFIAYILGLSHFVSLVFAEVLSSSNAEPDELSNLASTTFLAQMRVTTPVVHENQDLYYEIQKLNPAMAKIHDKVNAAATKLSTLIKQGERERFTETMSEMQDYFGQLNQTIARVEF